MNSTTATIGTGRAVHFAYYVGDKLTGTYCDRAAWETKRVRPMHSLTADDVTCARCRKVAASPDSVPNTVAGQLADARAELVEVAAPLITAVLDEVEAPVATPSTDPGWYTEPHLIVAADTETLVKVHAAALTAYGNAGGHRFAAMNERVYLMCRAELAHRGAYDPGAVDEISRVVMERARKPRPSHNADACAVRGCVWIDAVIR